MTELRWVLAALGVLLVLGVYLWSRGFPQRWLAPLATRRKQRSERGFRVEPELPGSPPELHEVAEPLADSVPVAEAKPDSAGAAAAAAPEKVVTIRFLPHAKEIASDKVILALRAAGLKHGKYGIFHCHANAMSDEALFSVASLTEPGSFDLTRLSETKIAGMSIFMLLPGAGDPVECFDRMVATAKDLARELDGELRDEKGSSWSIQRERYVREEIIEYRHLLDMPRPD